MSDPMKERAKMLGESPAFPVEYEYAGGKMYCNGATLRAYLVAHAPAEPWPEFTPTLNWGIERPSEKPIPNNGVARNKNTDQCLAEWRKDPCWDAEEEHPDYSEWIHAWHDYWDQSALRDSALKIARRIQWPAYWADRMLEELAK